MSRPFKLVICCALATFATAGCSKDPSPDSTSRIPQPATATPTQPTNPSAGTSGSDLNAHNPTWNPSQEPPPMLRMDPDRCTGTDIMTRRITPTVMLVVDGSTSMRDPYNVDPDGGMGGPSRWDAVRNALVGPDGVVPQLQDLVKFGLAVYGTQPSCPLPLGVVMPALENGTAVANGLPGSSPGTYTPSGAALAEVVRMLPDPTVISPDADMEPQVIIFATDGNPNACMAFGNPPPADYQPSIDAALMAQSKHQKLFVISVGDDASAAHLQELANIGAGLDRAASPGATVYYPEDPVALASTLQMLIGAELSCEVVLDGKGVRPGKECSGTVSLNGMPLPCDADGTATEGFQLLDPHHILLKGNACETYKSSASAVLNAMFPCDALLE